MASGRSQRGRRELNPGLPTRCIASPDSFSASWFCTLIVPGRAAATTIDPLLFEELVLGADFVGIVECDQAGGIVARYRVIESWKCPIAPWSGPA
jgi:hypothetical protein